MTSGLRLLFILIMLVLIPAGAFASAASSAPDIMTQALHGTWELDLPATLARIDPEKTPPPQPTHPPTIAFDIHKHTYAMLNMPSGQISGVFPFQVDSVEGSRVHVQIGGQKNVCELIDLTTMLYTPQSANGKNSLIFYKVDGSPAATTLLAAQSATPIEEIRPRAPLNAENVVSFPAEKIYIADSPHYILLAFDMRLIDQETTEALRATMNAYRIAFTNLFSKSTLLELQPAEWRAHVTKGLLASLPRGVPPQNIEQVYITEFVVKK